MYIYIHIHNQLYVIIHLQFTFCISGRCFGLADRHSICALVRMLAEASPASPVFHPPRSVGWLRGLQFHRVSSATWWWFSGLWRQQQNIDEVEDLSPKGTSSSMKCCFLGRKPAGSCDVKKAAIFHRGPGILFHLRNELSYSTGTILDSIFGSAIAENRIDILWGSSQTLRWNGSSLASTRSLCVCVDRAVWS